MKFHSVWLLWSSAFLVPWTALHLVRPAFRGEMVRVSPGTSLFGLYWAGVYEHFTWHRSTAMSGAPEAA